MSSYSSRVTSNHTEIRSSHVSFTCPSHHPPAWKQSTASPRARVAARARGERPLVRVVGRERAHAHGGGGLEERRARVVLEREVADLVAGRARAADAADDLRVRP
jgi:hypothetical protein